MLNRIIIENTTAYRSVIEELLQQINGEEGQWVLSEENKILKISERIHCVINPFALEVNSKKIVNKIFDIAQREVMESKLYLESSQLFSDITNFVETMICQMEYPLTYQENFGLNELLKMVGFRLQDLNGNLLEKILDYIKIYHQLLGYEIFILLDAEAYLSENEIYDLLRHAEYEKVHIVIIASVLRECDYSREQRFIIDKDLCEIYCEK